jgi:hypothetical protein
LLSQETLLLLRRRISLLQALLWVTRLLEDEAGSVCCEGAARLVAVEGETAEEESEVDEEEVPLLLRLLPLVEVRADAAAAAAVSAAPRRAEEGRWSWW